MEGSIQVEEQAAEGNGPTWRPIVRQGCNGEMVPCQSEEEEPREGSDLSIWFQEVVTRACAEGLFKICLTL